MLRRSRKNVSWFFKGPLKSCWSTVRRPFCYSSAHFLFSFSTDVTWHNFRLLNRGLSTGMSPKWAWLREGKIWVCPIRVREHKVFRPPRACGCGCGCRWGCRCGCAFDVCTYEHPSCPFSSADAQESQTLTRWKETLRENGTALCICCNRNSRLIHIVDNLVTGTIILWSFKIWHHCSSTDVVSFHIGLWSSISSWIEENKTEYYKIAGRFPTYGAHETTIQSLRNAVQGG